MSHFIKDNTALGDAKVNFQTSTGIPSDRKINAVDWNTFRQALLDTKAFLRAPEWVAVAQQASDPSPAGITSYLYLDNNDSLFLRAGGIATEVGAAQFVTAKSRGAAGDGVADDTVALKSAVDTAIAKRKHVWLDAGTYRLTKEIDILGAVGLHIVGAPGAVIRYPSDDTGIVPDAAANTTGNPPAAARSAFLLRYCSDVAIDGITFVGGEDPNLNNNNGYAVYAQHCVGIRLDKCSQRGGAHLLNQEVAPNSTSSGGALVAAAGVATLTDSAGKFTPGHVGRRISIPNAVNIGNRISVPIASYISSTQVTFVNADAVTEAGPLYWEVDDADRNTRISKCSSYGARASIHPPIDFVISECHFELPGLQDAAGRGDSFTLSGGNVTLKDAGWSFGLLQNYVGKYVAVEGSTTPGNNGTFQISSATPATLFSPAQIVYANGSGATEAFTGTWHIAGGDKVGAGAGTFTKVGTTMTFAAASVAIFAASDVGKCFRPARATSAANNSFFTITQYVSPTTIKYEHAAGVAEAFTGLWSVDAYDATSTGGVTHGSSHTIYCFAGRGNGKIDKCTFKNIRKNPVKVSGSSAAIRGISVTNCTAIECSSFVVAGADDSQEHTTIEVVGNHLFDVGTGRPGWCLQIGIWILGARNVVVERNQFHYTRPAISAVDGHASVGGLFGIVAARYLAGISQPIEDARVDGNIFTGDPAQTSATTVLQSAIRLDQVGQRARYATAGTLTKAGTTMTLTDSSAAFNQAAMVGASIQFVNAPDGANNVTATVTAVTGTSALQFENASGVGGGVGAGTYRIQGLVRGGLCSISRNEIGPVAGAGVEALDCVAPQILDNTFSGITPEINASGSLSPYIDRNRSVGRGSTTAGIRLDTGTSWPLVGRNSTVAGGESLTGVKSRRGDIPIGVDSSVAIDHPLLGLRGRVRTADAKEEIVFAYGSRWVDGDSFKVNGALTYTYKATSPGARQFNTMAGLIALIVADGFTVTDYGAGFAAGSVATGHIRVRRTATSAADGNLSLDTFNILNPTACVVGRNNTGSGEAFCSSRGSGSAGPTADKVVIWSPACTLAGGVHVWADNSAAQTLLASSHFRAIKNANDAGCCEVLNVGSTTAAEEYRWAVAA